MKNYLAVICIAIIIISTCGCLWNEENEKKEKYVLEAVISVDKNIIYENDTITFNASSSNGDIKHYYWNFTGGNNWDAEGVEVTHEYSGAGHYIAKLKVVDVNGNDSYDHVDVYVNYYESYSGSTDKGEKINYDFPVNYGAKKATITLIYIPTYPLLGDKIQIENLDLSILAKWNNTYEYVSCSNNTNDKGKEAVDINRYDILYHEPGEWLAEIYYNETSSSPSASSVEYDLTIDVHYD